MESERQSRGIAGVSRAFLIIVALIGFDPDNATRAADVSKSDTATEDRVQALIPAIEAYIASGMRGFDVPGLALGIVAGDKLIYAKGFGVRSKSGGMPVDTRTIFQIGSNAKAFLAATEAIMVDRGKLRWDDRVVDLDPEFQLKDPWVKREFRVFDLLAQRSGLPPFVNDMLAMTDFDEAALILLVARCRTGVEFPNDLCLHQHHTPFGQPDRREGRERGGLEYSASAGAA